MSRLLLPFLLWYSCFGQSPTDLFEKAPPDVDEALRARIAKFYQAHVNGKFRLADEVVADDSKDFFFAANKPKYIGFEISKITYSDNFTQAKATVTVETFMNILGLGNRPVKVPLTSRWKVVDGQWFWYVDPNELNSTPFGEMKAGPDAGPPGAPATWKMPDVRTLWNQVKADKTVVTLKSSEPSTDSVLISNQMPGSIFLSLNYPKSPGVEVKLDREEVKAGEKATVTFRSEPRKQLSSSTIPVHVLVQPTNQIISIDLSFSR